MREFIGKVFSNFEPVINTGNILTILFGFIALFGIWVEREVAVAKQEEKIISIERRVANNEKVVDDVQRIKVDIGKIQEKQDIMLELLRDSRR